MPNTKKISFSSYYSAFTLVELIVVIVILAILATIAFLSFSSQSSSARDSTRMSDLSNISKWLWVFNALGWKYPIPDKSVSIYSWTTLIWYQWEAWSKLLGMLKLSAWWWKDPLGGTYYTYNINNTRNKHQLLAFLENQSSFQLWYNPFDVISDSFATDYTNRYPYEKWDTLWILLAQTWTTSNPIYTPIQDIPSIQTSTWFTITDTSQTTWKIIISDNAVSSTWVSTSAVIWYTTPVNPIPVAPVAPTVKAEISNNDSNLILLWHFNESAWSIVYDNTGGTNVAADNWTLNWAIWDTSNKIAWAASLTFDWINNFVRLRNHWRDWGSEFYPSNNYSITAWVNFNSGTTNKDITGAGWRMTFGITSDNRLYYWEYPYYYNGANWGSLYSSGYISEKAWHQVAMTKSSTLGLSLYVDWVLAASAPGDTPNWLTANTGNAIWYNGNPDYMYWFFSWMIDEFAAYNRVLTSTEIQNQYQLLK
ncbi:MAG: Laminin G sub protein [uncultured bacterium (gcode 4)]|uniref:Laminin G sub protein n=1 Tax=uncultured bacterium (gcode 4) TaxID=1234023 RepID=K2G312_9BACT|nr:MAG: Laminin G sub protein [uncultured bacterium (gcode 4)]